MPLTGHNALVVVATMASLLMLAAPAWAQTNHELEVGVGVGWLSRTDLQVSPLQYTGVTPTFALAYSARGRRDVNDLTLALSIGSIGSNDGWTFTKDDVEKVAERSPVTLVDLQYAYARRFDGEGWVLNVGGTSSNHFEDLVYVQAFNSTSTYFGALELGPWVDFRLSPHERHHLEVQGWVPLVAWIGRQNWSIHDDEYLWDVRKENPLSAIFNYLGGGSFQTWNHYQAVHLRVAYRFDLGDHWSLFTEGRADGYRYSEPRPVVEWQLALDAGVKARF